jgi:hypothetical protein
MDKYMIFPFSPTGWQKQKRAGENILEVSEDKLFREVLSIAQKERKIGIFC